MRYGMIAALYPISNSRQAARTVVNSLSRQQPRRLVLQLEATQPR
jgi:hypothetical protein